MGNNKQFHSNLSLGEEVDKLCSSNIIEYLERSFMEDIQEDLEHFYSTNIQEFSTPINVSISIGDGFGMNYGEKNLKIRVPIEKIGLTSEQQVEFFVTQQIPEILPNHMFEENHPSHFSEAFYDLIPPSENVTLRICVAHESPDRPNDRDHLPAHVHIQRGYYQWKENVIDGKGRWRWYNPSQTQTRVRLDRALYVGPSDFTLTQEECKWLNDFFNQPRHGFGNMWNYACFIWNNHGSNPNPYFDFSNIIQPNYTELVSFDIVMNRLKSENKQGHRESPIEYQKRLQKLYNET